MKHTKRVQRWSVLLLMIGTTVIMGWSVSRPMPQQFPALPPGIALAKLTASPQPHSSLDGGDGSDFIDPLRFPARSPADRTVPSSKFPVPSSETEASTPRTASPVIPGRAIRLEPKGSLTVSLSGRIEFVATLANIQTSDWRVIGELYVTRGDGMSEKLFGPRAIRLGRAQTLRLPVGFAAKRFSPGPTKFIAILKDQDGQVIDQATVTFTIELGH
jgi:multidrug efflux pump subunit AcrA (membrane-fusion protein)